MPTVAPPTPWVPTPGELEEWIGPLEDDDWDESPLEVPETPQERS